MSHHWDPETLADIEAQQRAKQEAEVAEQQAQALASVPPGPGGAISPAGPVFATNVDEAEAQGLVPPPPPQRTFAVEPGRGPSRAAVLAAQQAQQNLGNVRGARDLVAAERQRALGQAANATTLESQRSAEALFRQQRAIELMREEQEQRMEVAHAELRQHEEEANRLRREVSETRVGRENFFARMSTGTRIANAIGMFLGAIGSAGTGRNEAMIQLEKLIAEDLQVQRESLETKKGLLGREDNITRLMWQRTQDIERSSALAREMMWAEADRMVQAFGHLGAGERKAAEINDLRGQIADERLRAREELAAHAAEAAARAARGSGPRYVQIVGGVPVRVTRQEFLRGIQEDAEARHEHFGDTLEAIREAREIDPKHTQWIGRMIQSRALDTSTVALEDLVSVLDTAVDSEIPGITPGTSIAELLGSAGRIPNAFWRSPQGVRLIQSFQNALTIRTFSLSGKQTNEQERRRLNEAVAGPGPLMQPLTVLAGIRMLARENEELWGTIHDTSDPRAWQRFVHQRGVRRQSDALADPISVSRRMLGAVEGVSDRALADAERDLQDRIANYWNELESDPERWGRLANAPRPQSFQQDVP
jgi:hypothetical protein